MSQPERPHLLLRPLLWLRRRWQGVLLLFSMFLLVGEILVWRAAHYDQRDTVRWLGRKLGYEVEVGSLTLPNLRRLAIRDMKVGDFARVERLELSWSPGGLALRRLDQLRVHGLEVRLGAMQAALEKARHENLGRKPSGLFSFTLKRLVISQSRLILDNLGAGIPPMPLRMGDVTPIVFENLTLGGAEADPASQVIQIAILEDVVLYSPYDATAPVLSFDKIRLGFSWTGIQQKQLDQLSLEKPTIFIGPDLFWFSDRLKEAAAKAEKSHIRKVPWSIANFQIIQGGLVLTNDGQPSLRLPLTFETQQTGLILSDFNDLQLARAGFRIPLTNLPYPEYNLSITGMQGELFFSLPLEERGIKDLSNITPALKIQSAKWKGLEMRDIDISVTFDRKGIYGKVFGKAYQGMLEGGFSLLLDNSMSWNAWASTTRVELDPVTNLLSPEHFVMKGLVDSSFEVKGKSKNVVGFTGKVQLNQPGTMTITAVDRVLQDLPSDWSSLKKELSRVSLEAFRDYHYHGGTATVAYHPPLSEFRLNLDGEQGKRNFKLTWEDRGLMANSSQAEASQTQPKKDPVNP